MKKSTYILAIIVTFLFLGQVAINAQTFVSDWGTTPRGSNGWTILNTASTPAGSGSMGGTEKPTGWMSIKGGFAPLTATTSQAFVITGTFEFVGGGGGNAYTWLRFALFNGEGTLSNKNTPTAAWSETSNGNGYIFTPVTGVGTISNTFNTWPQGNQGTNWPLINSKSWTSTNSNGGGPFATVMQAPSRQVATAGVYDFAISVQPLANGTNEVRWYFVQQHAANSQNYYWWGGSFIDDRVKQTTFNSIGFACNNDLDATTKQVNLANVKVSLGNPITIPEAPWQAYYVDTWGNTPRGTAWPILNTADYIVGNASMGADKKPAAWASIKGGFREAHVPTTKKALIVSGTFEMVGGTANNAYTWLRYALTYQDSAVLNDQNKTTANWTGKNHWGYEFTPRSGVGELANGSGGSGVVWTVNNSAGWNSTYSNNGAPLITVLQAPSRAVATAGVYDWAISVQPLADGSNEIRWYFVKKAAAGKQSDYWFAGIAIDKNAVAKKFNGICFSMNNDVDETLKQVNINDVKVDMGNPITIPEAPWQAYYVDQWGNTPQGTNWPILNTADYIVGNASMGADKKPSGWATIKGGFREAHTPTTKKALIVKGTLEFVGGGANNAYTWLRYALTYQDSAKLNDQNKTTANWTGKKHFGYQFTPRTGVGELANGSGGSGTLWTIKDGSWNSTWSNNGAPVSTVLQAPARAVATAGVYDWAISVQPLADGTNEVRWYLQKKPVAGKPTEYWFGGTYIDPTPSTTKFNGILFGFNNDLDETCKQVNINDVQVDMGNPITVPEAPWQSFYVDTWGILGQRRGNAGWVMTPGDVVGDVTISGTAAPATDFAVVRGQFATVVTPTTAKALIITGNFELIGGGFDNFGLRYGLFNSDAGKVETTAFYNWLGSETNHSGYLFVAPTNTKYSWSWPGGKTGSFGGISNGIPIYNFGAADYPVGTALSNPINAVSKAGIYDFAISIQPLADGTAEIRHFLTSRDKKYYWAEKAVDKNNPRAATKFNSIVFGLNSASATALKIHDVKVDIGTPITLPTPVSVEQEISSIPTEYKLNQNYPNPFNPTTTIEFALPKAGQVKLVVYDVLGSVVAELVNKELNAGYHKVDFNASNISSGVYFYSINTGEFTSVKKLILLK